MRESSPSLLPSLLWVLLSALGLVCVTENIVTFLFAGFVIGYYQWLLLRPVPRAWLWIFATGLGWPFAFSVLFLAGSLMITPDGILFGFWGTVLLSAIFGLVFGGLQAGVQHLCKVRVRFGLLVLGHGMFLLCLAFLMDTMVPVLSLGFLQPDRILVSASYGWWHYPAVIVGGVILGLVSGFAWQWHIPKPVFLGRKFWVVVAYLPVMFVLGWWVVGLRVFGMEPNPPAKQLLRLSDFQQPQLLDSVDSDSGWTRKTLRFTTESSQTFLAYLFESTITGTDVAKTSSLVLFLQGSGWNSVKGFCRRTLAPFVSENRQIACLERLAVKPGENKKPKGFFQDDYKEVRVRNANQFLDAMQAQHPKRRVILIGHSEAADVVASVAAVRNDIDALVMMSGAGIGMIDDFRLGFYSLLDSHNQGLNAIFSRMVDRTAYRFSREVMHDPTTSTEHFLHTNRYVYSYSTTRPVDDVVKYPGPVLLVHGDKDSNSPVESSRHAYAEAKNQGKKNIHYEELFGLDHSYRNENNQDHLMSVMRKVFDWTNTTK
jgi:pimeloyl-ACP methyl ester carboxylesterase